LISVVDCTICIYIEISDFEKNFGFVSLLKQVSARSGGLCDIRPSHYTLYIHASLIKLTTAFFQSTLNCLTVSYRKWITFTKPNIDYIHHSPVKYVRWQPVVSQLIT